MQISCLWHFYPRPPRGGRLHLSHDFAHACQFLSTPSARRATDYFNSIYTAVAKISIHALREEGDVLSALIASASKVFLSTPSARRATIKMPRKHLTHDISIHALREEGDQQGCAHALCNHRFLSTPSARRATSAVRVAILSCVFLSTPSARRATVHFLRRYRLWANFYPRPPRGGRRPPENGRYPAGNFYPRPPRGGRQRRKIVCARTVWSFLSTPSARRATRKLLGQSSPCSSFLSTPSARRATEDGDVAHHTVVISIHALREEGDFWTSMC